MKTLIHTLVLVLFLFGIGNKNIQAQVSDKEKAVKTYKAAQKHPKQAKEISTAFKKHPKKGKKVIKDAYNNPGAVKRNYRAAEKHPKQYREVKKTAKKHKGKAQKKYHNNKGRLKSNAPESNYKQFKKNKKS